MSPNPNCQKLTSKFKFQEGLISNFDICQGVNTNFHKGRRAGGYWVPTQPNRKAIHTAQLHKDQTDATQKERRKAVLMTSFPPSSCRFIHLLVLLCDYQLPAAFFTPQLPIISAVFSWLLHLLCFPNSAASQLEVSLTLCSLKFEIFGRFV